MANFLELLSDGNKKRTVPIQISAGSADAEKIVQTSADGKLDSSLIPVDQRFADFNTESLTTNKTLILTDPFIQYLTPVGADRDVILPIASLSEGRQYRILNTASTGNNRLRIIDNGSLLISLKLNKAVSAHSDGVQWYLIEIN